jgi:WD40 repeat protein
VTLWDVPGKKLICSLGLLGRITGAVFSADSRYLSIAIGGKDKPRAGHGTYVLDTESGKKAYAHLGLSTIAQAFSPTGPYLTIAASPALGRLPESVRVHDLRNPERSYELSHLGAVSVAFSPDGLKILTGGSDGSVVLWRVKDHTRVLSLRHAGTAASVAFSRYGEFLASTGEDRTVRVWHGESGRELATLPHESGVGFIRFAQRKELLATVTAEGVVRAWNWPGRKEQMRIAPQGDLRGLSWVPDTDSIATFGDMGASSLLADGSEFKLWDLRSGASKVLVTHGRDQRVKDVALDPRCNGPQS